MSDEDNTERLRVLASFLRSQALLTDHHPPKAGQGAVHLNRDETLALARAIEELRTGEHYLRLVEGFLYEQAHRHREGEAANDPGDVKLGHHDAMLVADAVDLLVDCRRAEK